MDTIFDHIMKEHNLATCNIEEELHIAAKLGRELLIENDSLRERNRFLWEIGEERAREIEMLRNQNKSLRYEADAKAAENDELERRYGEVEQRLKLLKKEISESHGLISSLSESVSEAEKLCVDKTRITEELKQRISELQQELESKPESISLALSPIPRYEPFNLNSHISRLEKGKLCLEEEVKTLMEEKMKLIEEYQNFQIVHNDPDHSFEVQTCPEESNNLTLDSLNIEEMPTECPSDAFSVSESTASDSWLTEKLATLEDWYNRACEACICGACESIASEIKSEKVPAMSYKELFDEVFIILRSIKHLNPKTPSKGPSKSVSERTSRKACKIASSVKIPDNDPLSRL